MIVYQQVYFLTCGYLTATVGRRAHRQLPIAEEIHLLEAVENNMLFCLIPALNSPEFLSQLHVMFNGVQWMCTL